MKRKKLTIAILVLSLLFLTVAVSGIFFIPRIDQSVKAEDTTTITATVKSIERMDKRSIDSFTIHTQEYGDRLFISDAVALLDRDAFTRLKAGDVIQLSVWKFDPYESDDSFYLPVVALRTGDQEIMSLASYNDYQAQSFKSLRMVFMVFFFPIFSHTSVHCILLLKVINVFRRFVKSNRIGRCSLA